MKEVIRKLRKTEPLLSCKFIMNNIEKKKKKNELQINLTISLHILAQC